MGSSEHNGTPAYQRIQGAIRTQIEAGELKPGDAVASERELARVHGVSLMTARHALAGLEHEGMVERRGAATARKGIAFFDLGTRLRRAPDLRR